MAGKFAGVGRATRWLALLGAMAASGGAFAAQEGGVPMPALSGAVEWLNSPPLTRESLRGKVVLVDFWTYGCINCQRSLPYVNAWAKKYAKEGLVVIGVHTPEYEEERVVENVRQQVKTLGIEYPVAIDNNSVIWRAFDNQYWPAHYFVDAKGQVRATHFGEGMYQQQEQFIQRLLAENHEQ